MCRRAQVWVTDRELVYLGPALGVRPHRTAVPRQLLGVDGDVSLCWSDGSVDTGRAFYVPARTKHAVAAPGAWWVVVYLEPGSYRDIAARHLRPHDHAEVVDHVLAGNVAAALAVLGPAGRAPSRLDSVIEEGLSSGTWPPAEVAAASIGLSLSQFLRVFASSTGTTYRRFGQWSRLLAATRRLPAGTSLTEAAADAGFASSSHLSDTVREVFGFTPTELLRTGATITVLDG